MNARLDWKLAIRDSGLDSTAKLVAFTLETWMNAAGANAYPSRGTIAKGAGVTVRTAEKALARLEASGYLTISRSKGRKVNRYEVALPDPNGESPSPLAVRSTANLARATANLTTTNGESPSPELELNPSFNPSPAPAPVAAARPLHALVGLAALKEIPV